MSGKLSNVSVDDKLKLATEITKRFRKKPVYNRIPKNGFKELYQIRDKVREDLLKGVEGDFAELLEVEGLTKSCSC